MPEQQATFEGGCTCGKIRYRMESPPLIVHCCHCTWCQRQSGTAFALNALIEASRVTILQGDPEMVLTPSPSGKGQKIWRCPECRIAVWSNYAGFGDLVRFIRVGTLDDVNRLPPDIHIFTETKQPWVVIPEGSATVDVYYDKNEVWPEHSLLRLRELFRKD